MTLLDILVLAVTSATLIVGTYWLARITISRLARRDGEFAKVWRGWLSALPQAEPYSADGVLASPAEKREQARVLKISQIPKGLRNAEFGWVGKQILLTVQDGALNVEVDVSDSADTGRKLPLVVRVEGPEGKSAGARLSADRPSARLDLTIAENDLGKYRIAIWGAKYAEPAELPGAG
jgi:hypothetical protein